jgi:hypothetical protein
MLHSCSRFTAPDQPSSLRFAAACGVTDSSGGKTGGALDVSSFSSRCASETWRCAANRTITKRQAYRISSFDLAFELKAVIIESAPSTSRAQRRRRMPLDECCCPRVGGASMLEGLPADSPHRVDGVRRRESAVSVAPPAAPT